MFKRCYDHLVAKPLQTSLNRAARPTQAAERQLDHATRKEAGGCAVSHGEQTNLTVVCGLIPMILYNPTTLGFEFRSTSAFNPPFG